MFLFFMRSERKFKFSDLIPFAGILDYMNRNRIPNDANLIYDAGYTALALYQGLVVAGVIASVMGLEKVLNV